MKFIIDRKPFHAALRQAGAALPGRTSLPELTAFMLALASGQLSITATDLEIGIVRAIACDGRADGVVAVDAAGLLGFVGALPDDATLTAEYDPQARRLALRAGQARAKLFCYDPDDYPAPPAAGADDQPFATIPAGTLRRAIESVAFAAVQKDEGRPTLQAVCLRFAHDRLTLSAADGFRMAVRHMALPAPVTDGGQFLPPSTALMKLAKMIDANDETPVALLHHRRNLLIARLPGLEFTTRLVDGSFPDWQQIRPAAHVTRAIAPAAALTQAAKIATVLDKGDSRPTVVLALAPGDDGAGAIEVTGAGDSRDNGDTLAAAIEGPPQMVALALPYLVEAVAATGAASVAVDVINADSAVLVRPAANEDSLHIIMPMNLAAVAPRAATEAVAAD